MTAGTSTPLGQGVTGLTLDMLAERIDHERDMRETREHAAAEALRTATTALEKRLEGMNEFRAALSEQNRNYVTVTVFDSRTESADKRLTILERAAERTTGAISTWRFLAGGGGILGLVSIALWIVQSTGPRP